MTRLDELRAETSADAEDRCRQAFRDCGVQEAAALAELRDAEAHLGDLFALSTEGPTEDRLAALLSGADKVRRVSELRAAWCRACTKAEQARWSLDKLLALRTLLVEDRRGQHP